MALGSITVPEHAGRGAAPVFHDVLSFAGDSAYPTGGSDFAALHEAAVGAGREVMAIVPIAVGGYQLEFVKASGKLKVLFGDNNNAADGPAVEVPNATDLSAVTFRVLVISR